MARTECSHAKWLRWVRRNWIVSMSTCEISSADERRDGSIPLPPGQRTMPTCEIQPRSIWHVVHCQTVRQLALARHQAHSLRVSAVIAQLLRSVQYSQLSVRPAERLHPLSAPRSHRRLSTMRSHQHDPTARLCAYRKHQSTGRRAARTQPASVAPERRAARPARGAKADGKPDVDGADAREDETMLRERVCGLLVGMVLVVKLSTNKARPGHLAAAACVRRVTRHVHDPLARPRATL